ncbi:hypothetical protein UFOVP658_92 [uncultured Caudovirales phage]|uniref:Uncharacterized protein n=1 Tax=uncultured Caudovirales phage TaxID=2100421 RepID=A0A6J5NMW1_9CAUD|nr:hypothetical protein UFOVP658_92 [uncultured Caudovirales phage]
MADDKSNKIVTKEFIQERDMRIFKMRQAGTSTQEIARRFGISTSAASKAVQRTLEKMNREVLMAYPEVLRMELERLDSLQQAIWPMTQHRKMTMDDGNEVAVEPDLKAIQQVLSIMDRRTKLLGMDQVNVSVQMDVQSKNNEVIKATLAGSTNVAADVDAFNPETEARQLLELMGISGVLPPEAVKQMLGDHIIVDAEIIDDGENNE